MVISGLMVVAAARTRFHLVHRSPQPLPPKPKNSMLAIRKKPIRHLKIQHRTPKNPAKRTQRVPTMIKTSPPSMPATPPRQPRLKQPPRAPKQTPLPQDPRKITVPGVGSKSLRSRSSRRTAATRPPEMRTRTRRATPMRRTTKCLIIRTRICTFIRSIVGCTTPISYSLIDFSSYSMRNRTWATNLIGLR